MNIIDQINAKDWDVPGRSSTLLRAQPAWDPLMSLQSCSVSHHCVSADDHLVDSWHHCKHSRSLWWSLSSQCLPSPDSNLTDDPVYITEQTWFTSSKRISTTECFSCVSFCIPDVMKVVTKTSWHQWSYLNQNRATTSTSKITKPWENGTKTVL